MEVPGMRRWVLVWFVLLMAAMYGADYGSPAAAGTPTAEEITQRVAQTRAAARVASADVKLKLFVRKSTTQPPDCTFGGTMRVEEGRPIVQLATRSPGTTCAIVERRALGPLFKSLEPLETFFARFELSVLNQKHPANDQYYRVQGKARDPKGDPKGFLAWMDYGRGTIVEGTINYAWGDMDTTQTYDRINNALVLTQQVLYSPKYNTWLELTYSNFGFAPK